MLSKRDQTLINDYPEEERREYNQDMASSTENHVVYINDKRCEAFSYTQLFMNAFKFDAYLNSDYKNMVQFGASTGDVLGKYQDKGWNTIGYEVDDIGVSEMAKKGITTRKIDLNSIELKTNKLSYEAQLETDLALPTHIILVRTLHYLQDSAIKLLIFKLIDEAKPGSVFFISGMVQLHNKKDDSNPMLLSNYIPSFFGPRSDMEFKHLSVNESKQSCTRLEEVMIVRKLG